ncbi:DNA primase, partial [Candidatus Parcubacteria bacterium]|nr:DNA primase [Candidatus Parcubacteria bacterium]
KEKLSVVDVLGSYITLEKAGANFKARCPFHNEKTPSFFVSPARNSYYCFGCAAKGDIFTFVQEFEGLDFVGALRILARQAGVPLERENKSVRTEREKMYLVMEHATIFFQKELSGNAEAKAYLLKRGLKPETIREWRLGYAPLEWKALFTYLKSKGFKPEDVEKVGLAKASDKVKGDYYDRFRGRIMFPIADSSGRIVAFSGRQFEKDGTEAKYINSPETALFEKSKILYGYDKAKLEIRKHEFSLLVEGQMDLLMSHQEDFKNTVASSGTALTEDQLRIIKRLSSKLIIAYDGDDAGGAAARRGWELALGLGFDVKIAEMPKGKDPADIILEDKKIFASAVANAKHVIDVELNRILTSPGDNRDHVLRVERELLPYVARVQSEIERSHFISTISHKANIKEDILWREVRKREPSSLTRQAPTGVYKETEPRKGTIGRMLFGLIYWQEKQSSPVLDALDIRSSLGTIMGNERLALLEAELQSHKDELVFQAEVSYEKTQHLKRHVEELIKNLKEEYLRESFAETIRALAIAERSKDSVQVAELLQKCQTISQELRKLSEKKAEF